MDGTLSSWLAHFMQSSPALSICDFKASALDNCFGSNVSKNIRNSKTNMQLDWMNVGTKCQLTRVTNLILIQLGHHLWELVVDSFQPWMQDVEGCHRWLLDPVNDRIYIVGNMGWWSNICKAQFK